MTSNKEDILLLSTADWDNPFWTNKQHVALELAQLGHKVLYVDSLGLRQPSMNKADLSRIFKRIIKSLKFPKNVRNNLWVCSPIVIPLQKYRIIRVVNKCLLYLFLQFHMFLLGFRSPILWTYNPITMDVFSVRKEARVVYHCVDEIKEQPGMPYMAIEIAEEQLLKRADYVFVTSRKLYETRQMLSNKIYMFENVADYNHFNKVAFQDVSKPEDMASFKKPIIGFIGAISGYKQDFKLLEYIAIEHPDWQVVLIGKVGEGDPGTDTTVLEKYENITLLGSRSYSILPAYIKSFNVAIIPAVLNGYTHSMFPMKFFEYLSTGKRIVSTKIDSLSEYSNYVYLADDYDDFIAGINDVLADEVGNIEERLQLASIKTYKARTIDMLKVITEL